MENNIFRIDQKLTELTSQIIEQGWQLTEQEQSQLTEQDRAKYKQAVTYKNHDWAEGPHGGWVRGNNILKELGWTEKIRVEGNREFVSLVKPEKR